MDSATIRTLSSLQSSSWRIKTFACTFCCLKVSFLHELIQHVASNWFSGKAGITNVTFKRFLSFMSWFNMFFQTGFRAKLASQMSHLNDFFPSCTNSTCFFKLVFFGKTGITNVTFEWTILCLLSPCLCLMKLIQAMPRVQAEGLCPLKISYLYSKVHMYSMYLPIFNMEVPRKTS